MAENQVYIGPWINWKHGRVLGATITIRPEYGNALLAFLALYVGWTGTHLWAIICYALHQLRSTTGSHDGLYYQQQAVLRNSLTPTAVLWRLLRMSWSWRHSTKGPIRRNLLLLLVAIVHVVSIFAAATLSSRVASPIPVDALVKSRLCGWPDDHVISNFGDWTSEEVKIADAMFVAARDSYRGAAAHARSCYGGNTASDSSICHRYASTRIVSKVNKTAPCPFAEGVCITPAISMDSGRLDSDLDLGITAPPTNRVQMRRVTTCAPILAEQKYSVGNITTASQFREGAGGTGAPEYIYYYLGPDIEHKTEFTYSISNYSLAYTSEPYMLKDFNALADNVSESDFAPIPPFDRSDADVNLLLLNRGILYTGQVTDPWFNATMQVNTGVGDVKWVSPLASTAVGCIEQYQFCNGDRCTPISGFYSVNDELISAVRYNAAQMATFRLLLKSAWAMQLRYLLVTLGTDVLLAKDKLYTAPNKLSPTLPPNQWHLEMENIHNITMAMLQRRVVEHALPPSFEVRSSVSTDKYVTLESDPESLRLCSHQRIRTSKYSSFSILGLAIIFVGGLFIILTGILLPAIVGWFQLKKERGVLKRREWIESETLQLQRTLFEGLGIRPWKGSQDAVPVTVMFGQKFQLGNALPTPGS